MKSPRHWNEARMDQTFGQGVLLSLHKLRLRSNQRGARWLLQEGVLMKGKKRSSFAEHYACIKNIMDWTWYDIRSISIYIYIYTSQSGIWFEHLQCLNVNWYHPSLLLQWLRFQKCNNESRLIMTHSIFIIIKYHKSTQSILPAIYFPNLQHENPLYILNLFEGNKTLDIQKKCFGYNLSNSRHFHDISQVIVRKTLIHHDPSWVHQKFRTRGFSPGPEYAAWDSETVASRKKKHHISPNSFGHPDMLGQLFICAGQILAGHLHPLNLDHFVAFCCWRKQKLPMGLF